MALKYSLFAIEVKGAMGVSISLARLSETELAVSATRSLQYALLEGVLKQATIIMDQKNQTSLLACKNAVKGQILTAGI